MSFFVLLGILVGFIDLWSSSLGTALTVLMAIVFVCRHDLPFSLLSVLWQGILWCTKFSIDEIAVFWLVLTVFLLLFEFWAV